MKCRFCRHWKNIEASDRSAFGRCHLNPPSIYGEDRDFFPVGEGTDHCSCFKQWEHPEVKIMGKLWEQEYLHNYRSHKVMLDHKTHELDRWVI